MSRGNVAIVLPGLIYEAPKLKQLMSRAVKRKKVRSAQINSSETFVAPDVKLLSQ